MRVQQGESSGENSYIGKTNRSYQFENALDRRFHSQKLLNYIKDTFRRRMVLKYGVCEHSLPVFLLVGLSL